MKASRSSIANRVLGTIVLVTSLMLSSVTALFLIKDRRTALEGLRQATEVDANQIANGLSLALWNLDEAQVLRVVESAMGNQNLKAISLKAEGVNPITLSRKANWELQKGTVLEIEQADIYLTQVITYQGKALGQLEMVATASRINSALNARARTVLITLLLFEVILSSLLYYLIWKGVILPLKAVESYALAVSHEDGEDAKLNLQGGCREIVLLKESIERMLKLLQERHEEQKKLQQQLYQSQKLESLGVLAGGIAHDFNNILTAIIGYVELAKAETSKQPELQEYMDDVLKAATRAKDLVKQILSFSRHGAQELKALNLELMIKEVVKMVKATFPSHIDVSLHMEGGIPLIVADPTQIHQVVMNLCTNAEHALRSRASGHVKITLDTFKMDQMGVAANLTLSPGLYVRLCVEDNGHGMNEATLSHIFEPFFTTKKEGEGTGLGLSVVHGIMKSLHGTVTAYSRLGEGTVFSLYFPASGSATDTVIAKPSSPQLGRGQKILFVDNEKAICRVVERSLPKLNYAVTTYTEPLQALARFEKDPQDFDLLMTDLSMPEMSGFELAVRVRALRPSLPVIICTGYLSPARKEELSSRGLKEVLIKPIDTEDLGAVLDRVLTSSRETLRLG